MFPEDVQLNIISFLGLSPRKRCWCRKPNGKRCTKQVSNTSQCIFCPIHEKARFNRPLYKPYEDLLYIVKKIGKFPKPKKKKNHRIFHTQPLNSVMYKIEQNFYPIPPTLADS